MAQARHMSHESRHASHVTRHTSHVTRHTSHVTRHTSLRAPWHGGGQPTLAESEQHAEVLAVVDLAWTYM
jgi:hypothetical protein